MKIKCIYNTGKDLMRFQDKTLSDSKVILKDSKGRSFWCTGETLFGGLEIGREYLVMGIIIRDGLTYYLIDDGNVYLHLLFEVINNEINSNWYFRTFTEDDVDYNNREAVCGYYELCFDDKHFIKLINMEDNAKDIFLKRKAEEDRSMTL